ncbi:uncharacterized protein LOC132264145 isoform X1 [Phlebotomus argentipes]|uniref:uncharacterized protein LOC132264145 isoform X1 n=1 Tax=Phlebotomus argentipes TaxID=94469 RepID=UPI00289313FE|nr:uncharacterized protein LOC132264145 isoform X1 [Phlebotomus argentipes]
MCRCLQSIWEDFYWHCIEEKFCYDESIAHYNPDEDEYIVAGKAKNGMVAEANADNNNPPICAQPMRIQRNCSTISSKIHEDDFHRDIQTNVPVLAPEILAVFRNSQIFHEHSQKISKNLSAKPTFITHQQSTTQHNITKVQQEQKTDAEEKLLSRLEDDEKGEAEELPKLGAVSIRKFSSIAEEDEFVFEDRTQRAPRFLVPPERPRSLKHVQSVPHLPIRPSSETDIFTITSSYSQISMTPEIPSISFTTLPKNYADTPSIEMYRESQSLQSIQTANCMRTKAFDFSMPRYFRHSELYPQASDPPTQTGSVESILKRSTSTQNLSHMEKSKRLKALRGALPPLLIAMDKEKH